MTISSYSYFMFINVVSLSVYTIDPQRFGVLYRDKLLRDIKRKV